MRKSTKAVLFSIEATGKSKKLLRVPIGGGVVMRLPSDAALDLYEALSAALKKANVIFVTRSKK